MGRWELPLGVRFAPFHLIVCFSFFLFIVDVYLACTYVYVYTGVFVHSWEGIMRPGK